MCEEKSDISDIRTELIIQLLFNDLLEELLKKPGLAANLTSVNYLIGGGKLIHFCGPKAQDVVCTFLC